MLRRDSKRYKIKVTMSSLSCGESVFGEDSNYSYSLYWKRGRKKVNSGRTQFVQWKENGMVIGESFEFYSTMFFKKKKEVFGKKAVTMYLEEKDGKNRTSSIGKAVFDLSRVITPSKDEVNEKNVVQMEVKKSKNFVKVKEKGKWKKKKKKRFVSVLFLVTAICLTESDESGIDTQTDIGSEDFGFGSELGDEEFGDNVAWEKERESLKTEIEVLEKRIKEVEKKGEDNSKFLKVLKERDEFETGNKDLKMKLEEKTGSLGTLQMRYDETKLKLDTEIDINKKFKEKLKKMEKKNQIQGEIAKTQTELEEAIKKNNENEVVRMEQFKKIQVTERRCSEFARMNEQMKKELGKIKEEKKQLESEKVKSDKLHHEESEKKQLEMKTQREDFEKMKEKMNKEIEAQEIEKVKIDKLHQDESEKIRIELNSLQEEYEKMREKMGKEVEKEKLLKDDLEKEKAELKKTIEKLHVDKDQLKKEKLNFEESKSSEISKVESELKQSEDQILKYTHDLEEKNKTLKLEISLKDDLQKKNKIIGDENVEMSLQLKTLEQDVANMGKLKQEKDDLQNQLAEAVAELKTKKQNEEELASIKKKLNSVESEKTVMIDEYSKRIEEMKKKLEVKETKQTVESVVFDVEKSFESEDVSMSSPEKKNPDVERESLLILKSLEQKKNELKKFKKDIIETEKLRIGEITELKENREKIKKENDSLLKEKKTFARELENALQVKTDLHKKLQDVQDENESQKDEILVFKEKIAKLVGTITERDSRISKLGNKIELLKKDVDGSLDLIEKKTQRMTVDSTESHNLLKEENLALLQSVYQLETNAMQLKKRINQSKLERKKRNDFVKSKVSEILGLRKELTLNKGKIQKLAKMNRRLLKENKRVVGKMENMNIIFTQQNLKIAQLMKEKPVNKNEGDLRQMKIESKNSQKLIDELKIHNETLKKEILEQEKKIVSFQETKSGYINSIYQLEEKMKKLKKRSDDSLLKKKYERVIKKKLREMEKLKVELVEYHNSKLKILGPCMLLDKQIGNLERDLIEMKKDESQEEVERDSVFQVKKRVDEVSRSFENVRNELERRELERYVVDNSILFFRMNRLKNEIFFNDNFVVYKNRIPQIVKVFTIMLLEFGVNGSFSSLLLSSFDYQLSNLGDSITNFGNLSAFDDSNCSYHYYFNVLIALFNILKITLKWKTKDYGGLVTLFSDISFLKKRRAFVILKTGSFFKRIIDLLQATYFNYCKKAWSSIKINLLKIVLFDEKTSESNLNDLLKKIVRFKKVMTDNRIPKRILDHFLSCLEQFIDITLFNNLMKLIVEQKMCKVSYILNVKLSISSLERKFYEKLYGKGEYLRVSKQLCDLCIVQNVNYLTDHKAKKDICPDLSLFQVKKVLSSVENDFDRRSKKMYSKKQLRVNIELDETSNFLLQGKVDLSSYVEGSRMVRKTFLFEFGERFINSDIIDSLEVPSCFLEYNSYLKKILTSGEKKRKKRTATKE